jgi:predicted nucleotidyltransferase component of viral defense system
VKPQSLSSLQIREVFHLEFLRYLSRKLKPDQYALKGGANLRFYFKSPRYSEDMDLDAQGLPLHKLRDTVMAILRSSSFLEGLIPFGIKGPGIPDMAKAKQTETTQRFKVHLQTAGGLDLYTKIEFSRRGFNTGAVTEPISDAVLRFYRQPPLLCSHYTAETAWVQKIEALAGRAVTQARDVFDLFLLGTQMNPSRDLVRGVAAGTVEKASHHALSVEFDQFRGAVLAYFSEEERMPYENSEVWDDIRLSVSKSLEALL